MTNTITAVVLSVLVTNSDFYTVPKPQFQTVYPETGEEVNPYVPHGYLIETVWSNQVARIVYEGKTNDTVLHSEAVLRRDLRWEEKTVKTTEWKTNDWIKADDDVVVGVLTNQHLIWRVVK